jgi:hypothetical protein
MRQPIAYIGNFRPSWSTENYIARSFEDIGIEVVRLQEDDRTSDEVIETCGRFNPQLLLYTRTWGLKDGKEAMFRVIERCRAKQIPTATFSLDLYWGINRENMIMSDPMFRTDIVFTADGGRAEDWKRAGVNHVWLPPGIYAKDCFFGTLRDEFKADVGFTGTVDHYHSEWPFRRQLVDALRMTYGSRFKWWGNQNNVRGWDLNDLYASCRVMVGDSLARPFYWSDRVPETMGRGGLLIAPEIEGMREQGYREGNLVFYEPGNIADCLAMVEMTLNLLSEEDYRTSRSWAMDLTKQRHTYEHRCRAMLDAIEGLHQSGQQPPAVEELRW